MTDRRRAGRRGRLSAQSKAGALGFAAALVAPRLARAALERLAAAGPRDPASPPASAQPQPPLAAAEPWRPVPAAELRARLPAEPAAPSARVEAVLTQLEAVASDLAHAAADERALHEMAEARLLEAAFGEPDAEPSTDAAEPEQPDRVRAEAATAAEPEDHEPAAVERVDVREPAAVEPVSVDVREPAAVEPVSVHVREPAAVGDAGSSETRQRPRGGRPRRALAYCVAFALPAAAAGAVAWSYLPEASADGTGQPAATLADAADGPGRARPPKPIVIRNARAESKRVARRARSRRSRPRRPVALSIPAAGVRARVDPVRQRAKGIEIPPVGRAGWFAAGPRPGEVGRTVIVGHLDGRRGPGLFARLPRLRDGSVVSVKSAGGKRRRYKVVGKTVVRKSRFPARAVYGRSRRSVLVLVTCGGPWSEARGYRDNVIVYARAL